MKSVVFMGSSLRDLKEFPKDPRSEAGYAIYLAQQGDRAINAIPMTGFGGAGVIEVVIPEGGDAYRAVYTINLAATVYVLHAFQKKSSKGSKTPFHDMKLIRSRLKAAERRHKADIDKLEKKHERGSG